MKPKQLWDDSGGSALVEFTIMFPLFLMLMFGVLQAGLLLYTQLGLQHGVEVAARCASVNYSANQLGLSQSCFSVAPNTVTTSNITAYAQANSWGINPSSAVYTVTGGNNTVNTCGTTPGYNVSASYTYNAMRYLFFGLTLRAQSCFPINIS
jgi:Flp pilus assembly protein TadG